MSFYMSLERKREDKLKQGIREFAAKPKIGKKLIPNLYSSDNLVSIYTKYICPPSHYVGHNLWILKPTKLNRGRGVHVFRNLDTMKDLFVYYTNGKKSNSISNEFIIQKYIESDRKSVV